ncbi:RNA N6-adenosine-methyltransferase METTL16 isoform X2 [Procambarus clarkii]|uniref:RNA N6-adenosine-methyltransferase METTL16 isoform X2 n=1 Tax=Procambarus clarkii TaxID=6728 RepID=UPI001E67899E|nr:RNA N6-adenosine-methyltransferase METTL16-like isoform X2 [Procambarus clarkii]
MTSNKKFVSSKLNKFMHQRNPYRTPPSFKKLALNYPEFRKYCTYDLGGKVHLDFKNPKAVRALTTCLLDQDFGLKVSIPDDRLVPTLPLRLNYLLWIEDLLTHAAHYNSEHCVLGIDIGVGAACVYPLLGAQHFGWCLLGTESDEHSYQSAHTNVQNNNLQAKILLKKVESNIFFKNLINDEEVKRWMLKCKLRKKAEVSESLQNCEARKAQTAALDSLSRVEFGQLKDEECSTYLYDFTMCNPPFFSSEEEADTMKKTRKDRGSPVSAPTGAIHEKVTPGGEVSFVTKMIDDSQLMKDKIRIFTTLIGTKANIKPIKGALSAASPSCSVVTQFCQGRTMRWGVAWTYDSALQLDQVRSKKEMVTNKPLVLMMPRSLMTVYSVQAAWTMVKKWLHQLKVKVRVLKSSKYFVSANVKAFKATWLHQRRKKRQGTRKAVSTHSDEEIGNISLVDESANSTISSKTDTMEETCVENMEEQMMSKDQLGGDHDSDTKTNECGDGVSAEHSMSSCQASCLRVNSPDTESQATTPHNHAQQSSKLIQDREEPMLNTGKVERLECILRCNLQMKQSGALVSMEAYYLDGSAGKDGLNQLLQFMRNQLLRPTV